MRPAGVVVQQVFGQYPAQVTFIDDQQPVEEFLAQGTYDPFTDRVRPGCLRWAGENPDAFGYEHRVEGASELARTIPDREFDLNRPLLPWAPLGVLTRNVALSWVRKLV
jgi:hypothetical protein